VAWVVYAIKTPYAIARNAGNTVVRRVGGVMTSSPALCNDEEVNTSSKLIWLELKQFVLLTSATSSGSANVMSTH